jgi:hypothetical protein
MEPLRDDQLIDELRALRPAPHPQFAAELDARAAAGFPRRSRLRLSLPSLPAKRLLIPASGVAVIVIAVVTALSVGGSKSSHLELHSMIETNPRQAAPNSGQASTEASGAETEGEEAAGASLAAPVPTVGSRLPDSPQRLRHRAVERSAAVILGADPEDVADDAAKVFEAVHAHNGIVMRSSTSQGRSGEAGARFVLLIPSRELGDAMAAFSEIDTVRSRHEATADITSSTISTAELLRESRARVESLLGQLEGAETETEQEIVEAELHRERRHAGRLAAQLTHLHRRADFSRVVLRIETGGTDESSGGGAWGFDDALHDAGHVLTVAAAVTLIALAILGPIGLIALLAWLTHRTWIRRERRRALG